MIADTLFINSVKFQVVGTTSALPPLWRVKHWLETGNSLRSRPEVETLDPHIATDFTAAWQHRSYELNTTANPLITENMTKDKWRALYRWDKWGMNGTGFEKPDDPRADFVNNRDTKSPLPKFDRARVFGGAVITGTVSGSNLIVTTLSPSIVPTLAELLTQRWLWFDAVNCGSTGTPRLFGMGTNENRVFVPLIVRAPVTIPLSKLQRLPDNFSFANYNPYKTSYP